MKKLFHGYSIYCKQKGHFGLGCLNDNHKMRKGGEE